MAKYSDFILTSKISNTDQNQKDGNSAFDTDDKIYFESYKEIKKLSNDERKITPSDYAVMNKALMTSGEDETLGRKTCWSFLRSASSSKSVNGVFCDGELDSKDVYDYRERLVSSFTTQS